MSENWEVGDRLEAQDYLNYWYTAKIIGSDAEKDLVLVHFEGWNSRYDEWVHVRSNRLRPLTASSSPSPSNNKNNNNKSSSASGLSQHSLPIYSSGQCVMALWSDGQMYPGKVRSANLKGEKYDVIFYDGVRKSVSFRNVRIMNKKERAMYSMLQLNQTQSASHHSRPCTKALHGSNCSSCSSSGRRQTQTHNAHAHKQQQQQQLTMMANEQLTCLYCSQHCVGRPATKCDTCFSVCCHSCHDLLQYILPYPPPPPPPSSSSSSFTCIYCTSSSKRYTKERRIGNIQKLATTKYVELLKRLEELQKAVESGTPRQRHVASSSSATSSLSVASTSSHVTPSSTRGAGDVNMCPYSSPRDNNINLTGIETLRCKEMYRKIGRILDAMEERINEEEAAAAATATAAADDTPEFSF